MPVVGEAGNRITWNHFLFVALGGNIDKGGRSERACTF
jgi:hypothetical protein